MNITAHAAGGVLTIGIDRPEKKNALTAAMYEALVDALEQADAAAPVRAVLLRGRPEVFCAGNDLDDFMQRPPVGDDAPVLRFLRRLAGFRKPLVAAVAGPAVGIGTTLLLHCDLVYAADSAIFALPFVPLGLCPEAASSLLLPRLAGYQRAAEKLLLGEPFDAAEAAAMGLVSRVLPAADIDAYARRQADKLAALPPASLRTTKRLMKQSQDDEILMRMRDEAEHFGRMLVAPEAREAFAAFFEKRKADFSKCE